VQDIRRSIFATTFGGLFIGPFGHFWYQHLDRVVSARMIPGSAKFIAAKVAADSFIYGPFMLLAFFVGSSLKDGVADSWERISTKLRLDFASAFVAECTIWPPVQVANFAFVPVRHQLLLVNSLAVMDVTFLSWVLHPPGGHGDKQWTQRISDKIQQRWSQ